MTGLGRAETIVARCRAIAACTEVAGETTRTFLSEPMHAVHALLRGWMEAAGMQVSVDAVGNLRGVYTGRDAGTGRLVIASHLDTVPNAGAFDGILGVVLGLAVVEELYGERLPFAIELIGFSEEEGVRFSKPFLGSLALLGEVDETLLARRDAQGVTVADAIAAFGLDVSKLPEAVLAPDAFAYLEVHIEQGPVLDSEGLALGVVSALVGQTRLEVEFAGQANHAGTTPMPLRHDAMAAAAEWIVEVERYARQTAGLVATVGRVEARPGAGNVIAGEVKATLDVRHAMDASRAVAVEAMRTFASAAAAARGVRVTHRLLAEQVAVPMEERLCELLEAAAADVGFPALRMVSGAGHDAMVIGTRVPATMLFVRSPGGLSHHPDEAVLVEDVEAALRTSLAFVKRLGGTLGSRERAGERTGEHA